MKSLALATLAVLLLAPLGCACPHGRPQQVCAPGQAKITAELNQMMHQSAKDWTADDLDAFMRAFHDSPDTRFAIPSGITLGHANIKARYENSIAKSNLWFTDIDVTPITGDTALVFARFHNEMKADQSYSTGLTSLLCKKINGRWVIVHDHSSGLPADTPRKDK